MCSLIKDLFSAQTSIYGSLHTDSHFCLLHMKDLSVVNTDINYSWVSPY